MTEARVLAFGGETKVVIVFHGVDLFRQTHPVLEGDVRLAVLQPLGAGAGFAHPRRAARRCKIVGDRVGDGGQRRPGLLLALLLGLLLLMRLFAFLGPGLLLLELMRGLRPCQVLLLIRALAGARAVVRRGPLVVLIVLVVHLAPPGGAFAPFPGLTRARLFRAWGW